MAITIAEKNNSKERIARKIEKAINDLVVSRDRHFLSIVEHEVRRRAIESVGVIEEYDRLQDIFKELGDLEAERQTVSMRIRRKVPEFSCDWSWRRNAVDCLDSVPRAQMSITEREVMTQSPIGRQLLKLRDEQEELCTIPFGWRHPRQKFEGCGVGCLHC